MNPQSACSPGEGRRLSHKAAPCPLGINSGREDPRRFRSGEDPFSRCGVSTPFPQSCHLLERVPSQDKDLADRWRSKTQVLTLALL